jgi:hypothetical protein
VLSEGDISLSIDNFTNRVLAPQTDAVAKYIERTVASVMQAVPTDASITYDATAPAKAFTAARKQLRTNGVTSDAPLYAAVGAGIYADLQDANTTTQPTFDASGKVRGFSVIESTRLDAEEAVLFVPNAFALVVRAPAVPDGAPFGASVQTADAQFALRYIRSFDASVAADRSIVSTFVGVQELPLAVDNEDGTVSLLAHGGVVHLAAA